MIKYVINKLDWCFNPPNVLHTMERVGTLIDNLKEQFIQEPNLDKMMPLVQSLWLELQQHARLHMKHRKSPIKDEKSGWLFDLELEVPEITLNEQLKPETIEIQKNYKESHIRDLKKAIGINDRYLFINELFRGDEMMYERSLKTINGFSIFPEAHYWIQRELKVKLGWKDRSETVDHFDQLVKRRFASM